MKAVLLLAVSLILIIPACQTNDKRGYIDQVDWSERIIDNVILDSAITGKTYLPVYSHIYHIHGQRNYDLTVTVSMRNTSLSDTIYISKADYYNTEGNRIRQYVKTPVFLAPMETIEIIIEDRDREGGSAANFIFDWAVADSVQSPLFEAVMISSEGQQGISFTTRGVEIE